MKKSNQDTARVLALLALIFSVQQLPSIASTFVFIVQSLSLVYLLPFVVLCLVPVAVLAVLLLRPDWLSGLLHLNDGERETAISLERFLYVCVVILGLYITIYAMVYLLQELFGLLLLEINSHNTAVDLLISNDKKAELLSYLVELFIGLFVALKAKKMTAFFIKK